MKKEFEENLLKSIDSLYNLAWRMTGNKEDAGDLVQEASLRAFRFYHKFERGTNFRAWILTILRNIFINKYRKRVKEPYQVSYDDVENFVSVLPTQGVHEEIFSENVQKSIAKLPEEMRTTVVLFYVEDMAYREIAGVMDCPIGTVMSRLHTAKKLIKKHLLHLTKGEHLTNGLR